MMKKLLVLTAVVLFTASAVGCQGGLFRRGSLFPCFRPQTQPCDPYVQYDQSPPCDSCTSYDPCAAGSCGGQPSIQLPGPVIGQ